MSKHSLHRALAGASLICLAGLPAAAQTTESEIAEPTEIIILSTPLETPLGESILAVSVLDKDELERRNAPTLGELLRLEPGVSSTFFGPGASRPIIRGLSGERIRVLDNGIGAIDASATSNDHAVAIEPSMAERVEVIRGPATLLYGSSAAGGVVNVDDGRIPSALPETGEMDGAARASYNSVSDEKEFAAGITIDLGDLGAGGPRLVVHGEAGWHDGSNYDIPGFAESALQRALEEEEHDDDDDHDDHDDDHDHEEDEEAFGVVENSQFETKAGSLGGSLLFSNGFIGVSGGYFESGYGLPGGHSHGHGHEDEDHDDEDHDDDDDDHDDEDHDEHGHGDEEGGVTIELEQVRFDLAGQFDFDGGFIERVRLRAGVADYEHAEIEPSGEIGTLFENQGFEGRVELSHRPIGRLDGAFGLQVTTRDFSAIGEEAFVPPVESLQWGVFALERIDFGGWRLEGGARFERTEHESSTGLTREFDAVSVSAGAGFIVSDALFAGVNLFRTERAPAIEELFSDGPHLATNAFEIGDPDLDKEVGTGIEATLRGQFARGGFTLNAFYTDYADYIVEGATGGEEDGLPVFAFTAQDAEFVGFEAEGDLVLAQAGGFEIGADGMIEYVRAEGDSGDLPRIPPLSILAGLEARSGVLDLRAEAEWADDQDNVAPFELPTDGYTQLNAFATWRPGGEAGPWSVELAGLNLSDEEIRQHTSFLKDILPLPGRSVRVTLRAEF